MGVKVYISGISGNKEVKKRQQRVLMILESRNIEYTVVDITDPGREADKDFMQEKSTALGATVSDTNPRHALPPQLFNDEQYCGDYDQFDLSNEIDELDKFLKLATADVKQVSNAEITLGNGTAEAEAEAAEPEPEIEPLDPVVESSEKAGDAELNKDPKAEEVSTFEDESSEPPVETNDITENTAAGDDDA